MGNPDFAGMSDASFLKWLAVFLHDAHGFKANGPILGRLASIPMHLEAATPAHVEGEPNAQSPTELRDAIISIIFKNYIGVSASRSKAEKAADAVLLRLMEEYEKEEVASAGGVQ